MRAMGIDYGSKRIGVALSDEDARFAFPHSIVETGKDALVAITALVQNESVGEIIVGESLTQDGTANSIMEAVTSFTETLGKATGMPIIFEKEFFTSVEARRVENESRDASARSRKPARNNVRVDASAAALILQRYLDRKNMNQ